MYINMIKRATIGHDLCISDVTDKQGVHLTHNKSGRFESRFTTVRINDSPAMMLDGMAGSVMGIWVAHGEGMSDDRRVLCRVCVWLC